MRRLIRPAVLTGIAIVAIVAFVLAGRLSSQRLDSTLAAVDRVEPSMRSRSCPLVGWPGDLRDDRFDRVPPRPPRWCCHG
jgi:hypothetical protein